MREGEREREREKERERVPSSSSIMSWSSNDLTYPTTNALQLLTPKGIFTSTKHAKNAISIDLR